METTIATEEWTQPVRRNRCNAGASGAQMLTAEDVHVLLGDIETATPAGLHDRAMLAVMLYCVVRPGALLCLRVKDYELEGDRRCLTLRESGGRERHVPVHVTAVAWLDAYLDAAGIGGDADGPLFRSSLGKDGRRKKPATGGDILRTVKNLARKAGVPKLLSSHTLRASGIALCLEDGGTVEAVRAMVGFRTTRSLERYVPAI
jgi:site-specific recombinase XerD